MAVSAFVVVGLVAVLYFGHTAVTFFHNLRSIRATGLPYVVLPFLHYESIPRILGPLWRPMLRVLPSPLRETWSKHLKEENLWTWLHNTYKEMESDSYLILTFTGRTVLHTCDPDVIMQVASRKNDFWKPLDLYTILDIYGKNVLTTDGLIWRRHRKVIGPPFSERNNHLVWAESLHSSQAMMNSLLNADGQSTGSLKDIHELFSRLALSIISKAGYGVRLDWPSRTGQPQTEIDDTSSDAALSREWIQGKTNGHTMSYSDAILNVSLRILPILIVPQWLLKRLPFESTKKAWEAYRNWGQYMREMIVAKRKSIGEVDASKMSYDLLASLVRSAEDSSAMFQDIKTENVADKKHTEKFTDEEILGDAFLLIIAGHETTAGALHHLSLMLAMNRDQQTNLQKEIDSLFGDAAPEDWDYEKDFGRLFGGLTGAMLAEVLRLVPPVTAPPKRSVHETDLMVNGKQRRIPGGLGITLDAVSAHRNPKYWKFEKQNPNAPQYAGSKAVNPENDLAEFKPQRWILEQNAQNTQDSSASQQVLTAEDRAMGFGTSTDTAATMLKPPKGAFLPYSEGHRACLGRRFAQIEVMAILATLFQRYSVELAVDEWASDEEVAKMSAEQKREVWSKASKVAEGHFRDSMMSILTHKMVKGDVSVRFVKRGSERFPAEVKP